MRSLKRQWRPSPVTSPPFPPFAPRWFDGLDDLNEVEARDTIRPGTRYLVGPAWLIEADRCVCAVSRKGDGAPYRTYDGAGALTGVCASWTGARRALLATALAYVAASTFPKLDGDEGVIFDAPGRERVTEALRRGLATDALTTFEERFARSLLVQFGAGRGALTAKQAPILRTILTKVGGGL